jgi:hypothetical protein
LSKIQFVAQFKEEKMKGSLYGQNVSNTKGKFVRALVILIVLIMVAQPAFAATALPRVFPPNSMPYGKTFVAWAAEWWQYVLSYPADNNPITDPTGANCAMGQSGPVFFLVGTTGGATVRDDCVVPAGKAVFFPLVNIFGAVPEDGATPEDVQALVSLVTNYIDELTVSVDGVPLQNLWDYRFGSPGFSFTGAVDNPFDEACGTPGTCYEGFHETGFSDGYWIMLAPLSAGEHTINFGGHFYFPDWDWEFEVDITYNLSVANAGPGAVR